MYVNGKYIPKSHPLYKPGRYKSFNDAAFSGLQNYNSTKSGYVQTSSPFRDYELQYSVYCKDRRKLERKAHKAVGSISSDRNNEWFKASVEDAVDCITGIIK